MLFRKEKRLFSTKDEYGLIQVTETDDSRCLYFDSSVEQCRLYKHALNHLAFEYQQSMAGLCLAHFNEYQQPRLLMLGLGGGGMASFLNMHAPKIQQTLVELRQAVIDVAYDYFYLPQVPEVETVCQDASLFMHDNRALYDLILVDLYNQDAMPTEFYLPAFQENLLRALECNGLIIFNLWQTDPFVEKQLLPFWQALEQRNLNIEVEQEFMTSTDNLVLTIKKDCF